MEIDRVEITISGDLDAFFTALVGLVIQQYPAIHVDEDAFERLLILHVGVHRITVP